MRAVHVIGISVALLLAACSTVIEGRTQRIALDTIPEGASCVLTSNEDVVAQVAVTPGVITVEKSKYDLVAECSKPGYVTSRLKNHADMAMLSLGNFVAGQWGAVGNFIDAATGAANKYDEHILVRLDKEAAAPRVAAAVAPASAIASSVLASAPVAPVCVAPLAAWAPVAITPPVIPAAPLPVVWGHMPPLALPLPAPLEVAALPESTHSAAEDLQ